MAVCPDNTLQHVIEDALHGEGRLQWSVDWATFEYAMRGAVCGIAVIPRLDEQELRVLEALKGRAADTPVVVITTRDAESARSLTRCGIEEVVWLGALERELHAAVVRARGSSFLRVVAVSAARTLTLPPGVRTAISMACRSQLPVRSVNELVRQAGLPHSTFAEIWHRKWPGGPTPKRFLSWILLLWAAALKVPNRGWEAIASELTVDEDTLSNLARRLLDGSLRAVSAANVREIRERFRREVLDRLGIVVAPDDLR